MKGGGGDFENGLRLFRDDGNAQPDRYHEGENDEEAVADGVGLGHVCEGGRADSARSAEESAGWRQVLFFEGRVLGKRRISLRRRSADA